MIRRLVQLVQWLCEAKPRRRVHRDELSEDRLIRQSASQVREESRPQAQQDWRQHGGPIGAQSASQFAGRSASDGRQLLKCPSHWTVQGWKEELRYKKAREEAKAAREEAKGSQDGSETQPARKPREEAKCSQDGGETKPARKPNARQRKAEKKAAHAKAKQELESEQMVRIGIWQETVARWAAAYEESRRREALELELRQKFQDGRMSPHEDTVPWPDRLVKPQQPKAAKASRFFLDNRKISKGSGSAMIGKGSGSARASEWLGGELPVQQFQ